MTYVAAAQLNDGVAVGVKGEATESPSTLPAYPAYKDSGVEWLGEVPQHWPIYSMKRTVDGCVNGLWGDEPDGENDIAVIRVADFERSFSTVGLDKLTYRSITPKERQSRLIKSGDLLIEKSGGGEKTLVGCVVLFTHEFDAITSNFVARMRPLAGFDSHFLCYAFGNLYHGRVNYPSVKQVTGIQNLDAESYLQERFCFPAIFEQIQIARFLDYETARIDALIEEQQRLIELLKEKRQAVISHAVTKGLDPTVPMKDSGVEWLGEVPAHWEVVSLKRVVVFQRGHDLPSDSREEGDVPIISSGGYSGTHSVACAKAPGIVTGRYGSIGSFILADEDYWPLNTALYSIELYRNKPRYVWYLLQGYVEHFLLNSLKSAVPGVDRNDVHVVKVVVAPIEEQDEISAHIDQNCSQLDQLVGVAENNVSLLQERRSAVISAAVTGKIDVRGWQPAASARSPVLESEVA